HRAVPNQRSSLSERSLILPSHMRWSVEARMLVQSIALAISGRVAPLGRRSKATTLATLEPGRSSPRLRAGLALAFLAFALLATLAFALLLLALALLGLLALVLVSGAAAGLVCAGVVSAAMVFSVFIFSVLH